MMERGALNGLRKKHLQTVNSPTRRASRVPDEVIAAIRATQWRDRAYSLRKNFGQGAVIRSIAYDGPEKPGLKSRPSRHCEERDDNLVRRRARAGRSNPESQPQNCPCLRKQ